MTHKERQRLYDRAAAILARALQIPEFDALVEAIEEEDYFGSSFYQALRKIQNSAVVVEGKVVEHGPTEIIAPVVCAQCGIATGCTCWSGV